LLEDLGQRAEGLDFDQPAAVTGDGKQALAYTPRKRLIIDFQLVGQAVDRQVKGVRVLNTELDQVALLEQSELKRADIRQRHGRRLRAGREQ
jgi:hypothetical protein